LASSTKNPIVLIRTSLGDIKAEIFEDKAPITAKNFLRYVDHGLFDHTTFFRTVTMDNQPKNEFKIEVIQGGYPAKEGAYPAIYPPIEQETTEMTGLRHVDGSLSMARYKPGTESSSFSVVINDQPEMDYGGRRNPDRQGFAVFGRVVEGMDVVNTIHKQPYSFGDQRLKPPIEILMIRRL